MKYFIKCIKGTHSRGDFTISGGQEKEVRKEVYDFYNNHYGQSGLFNFRVEEVKVVKAAKVEAEAIEEEPIIEEAPKETPKKKSTSKSK